MANVKTKDYGPNAKAFYKHSSFSSCNEVGCISVAARHLKFTTYSKDLLVLLTT
jgi:hypothetical protein